MHSTKSSSSTHVFHGSLGTTVYGMTLRVRELSEEDFFVEVDCVDDLAYLALSHDIFFWMTHKTFLMREARDDAQLHPSTPLWDVRRLVLSI